MRSTDRRGCSCGGKGTAITRGDSSHRRKRTTASRLRGTLEEAAMQDRSSTRSMPAMTRSRTVAMPRRLVDLSIYLENDVLSDPPPLAPKIEYQKHRDTVPEFLMMLPGVKAEDFPEGEAAAAEWVHLSTHNGTHLD